MGHFPNTDTGLVCDFGNGLVKEKCDVTIIFKS